MSSVMKKCVGCFWKKNSAYKADFLLLKPVAFAVSTVHEKPGPQISLAVQLTSHMLNLKNDRHAH